MWKVKLLKAEILSSSILAILKYFLRIRRCLIVISQHNNKHRFVIHIITFKNYFCQQVRTGSAVLAGNLFLHILSSMPEIITIIQYEKHAVSYYIMFFLKMQ